MQEGKVKPHKGEVTHVFYSHDPLCPKPYRGKCVCNPDLKIVQNEP